MTEKYDCGCPWCFNDPKMPCNTCAEACMSCQDVFTLEGFRLEE